MPEDCRWSSWSEWTQCTKTCGKGQRSKSRTIQRTAKNGGKDCVGNRRTTWQCQMKKCPEVAIDYKWSNWAKSGACSKSCGGGTQTWQRIEQIKSKNGKNLVREMLSIKKTATLIHVQQLPLIVNGQIGRKLEHAQNHAEEELKPGNELRK